MLQAYSWPGNVRELQNVVSRSVFLAEGPEVDVGDLPEECRVRSAESDGRFGTQIANAIRSKRPKDDVAHDGAIWNCRF